MVALLVHRLYLSVISVLCERTGWAGLYSPLLWKKKGLTADNITLVEAKSLVFTRDATEIERYVVEYIFDYGVDYENHQLFRMKWYAYASTAFTWKPSDNIHYNNVARYSLRKELPAPDGNLWNSVIGLDNWLAVLKVHTLVSSKKEKNIY